MTYYMISNRDKGGTGDNRADLTFWTSDKTDVTDLKKIENWTKLKAPAFQRQIVDAAGQFPQLDHADNEDQKHVTLFIHGFNNTWDGAVQRYHSIVQTLFSGEKDLGVCILFTWPSAGSALDYLPDRIQAKETAADLSTVLNAFYDWLLKKQTDAAKNPADACRAKTSIIAHSMGNYVLLNAMNYTWTHKNQPALVSLVNQCLMVAADVDNDIFDDAPGQSASGDGISNLTYRVTALYTGRDPVLGVSAGLKHFGKRRLGRSGLDHPDPAIARIPDNVWDVDCSQLIPDGAPDIHSSYFDQPKTQELMRQVLRGIDRNELKRRGLLG